MNNNNINNKKNNNNINSNCNNKYKNNCNMTKKLFWCDDCKF